MLVFLVRLFAPQLLQRRAEKKALKRQAKQANRGPGAQRQQINNFYGRG